MEFIDVMWFGGGSQCIGIVRCKDEYEGEKYYVGSVSGMDEQVDIEHIMAWGATFPKRAGDSLFGVA